VNTSEHTSTAFSSMAKQFVYGASPRSGLAHEYSPIPVWQADFYFQDQNNRRHVSISFTASGFISIEHKAKIGTFEDHNFVHFRFTDEGTFRWQLYRTGFIKYVAIDAL
jgi:hypothetical protein